MVEITEGGHPAAEGASERYERRMETVRTAIEMAEECARTLQAGPASALDIASLSSGLAQYALPHVESDAALWEATTWARDRLAGQRRQLARLIETLDLIGRHLQRIRGGPSLRRRLQRCLGELVDLLGQHLEEDSAVGERLRDGELPSSAVEALLDRAEAAERASANSLRFVLQPPLPETQATALRNNPAARRVRIVTGCGHSGEASTEAVQPAKEEVSS